MKPTIAIVVSTFPPYRGGMGNVAMKQALGLAKRGFNVTVATPGKNNLPDDSTWPFKVRRLKPLISYGNASFLPQLKSYLLDFDCVVLHYPFFGGVESICLTAKPFPPLFVYYHMDALGRGVFRTIFNIHQRFFLPKIIDGG